MLSCSGNITKSKINVYVFKIRDKLIPYSFGKEFQISHLEWLPFLILFKLCWGKLSGFWQEYYFYSSVVYLLYFFLHLLAFPITIGGEFCFCEDVRLFWHVITNHVHCAELPALRLSGDRNCELSQSASRPKEGIWYTLEELNISVKVIPTLKIRGRSRWLHV
jgi:hypothetical protein